MTAHPTIRELHRSQSDRIVAGVCGGLGRYFDVNPVLYRIGFVVLTLLGGAGLLVYGACVLVIPDEGEPESIASDILRNHRQRPVALVGLGLVAVSGIALVSRLSWHFHSDVFWVVVLIVGASLLWAQRPRRPHVASAAPDASTGEAPPAATRNRWRALRVVAATLTLLTVAVVAGAAAFVAPHLHLGDGIGTRSYQPATFGSVRSSYRLGVGDLRIDLSQLDFAGKNARTTIHARLGVGNMRITVPRGVTVRMHARAVWGDTHLLGNDNNGHDVSHTVGSRSAQLVLDAKVGIGEVEVVRAAS